MIVASRQHLWNLIFQDSLIFDALALVKHNIGNIKCLQMIVRANRERVETDTLMVNCEDTHTHTHGLCICTVLEGVLLTENCPTLRSVLGSCWATVASSERIKRQAWKRKRGGGREAVQLDSHFYGCYKIKIDWFCLQVLSFRVLLYSHLWAQIKNDFLRPAEMSSFAWFLQAGLSLLIQTIDSNQNNLNHRERAGEC